jgi:hypothetical protein
MSAIGWKIDAMERASAGPDAFVAGPGLSFLRNRSMT